MNTYRKTAISVGVLFITATAINVLGDSLSRPILAAPDYLVGVSAHANQVIMGGLLVLLSAFASAGIAIGLYPVLRKQNEALALGSVGLRVMEGMLYIVTVVGLLSLLTLSREYVKAGTSNASLFQASGTVLLAVKQWAGQLAVISFNIGALIYSYMFYQSRLVPRLISGWGVLASASSLAASLLAISGQIDSFSTVFILMQAPIAVQEYTLAVWLIVKGFNRSAVASLSAKTTTKELLSAS